MKAQLSWNINGQTVREYKKLDGGYKVFAEEGDIGWEKMYILKGDKVLFSVYVEGGTTIEELDIKYLGDK